MDILERDRKQIETQILAEIDTTEIVYLEQALEMLKIKENEINTQFEQPSNIDVSPIDEAPIIFEKQDMTNNAKLDWFDVTDEGATCVKEAEDKMASLNIQSELNPDAKEFVCDLNDDLNQSEFPLGECELDDEEDVEETAYADIDKQNQAKYFYFYQGKKS